MRKAYLGFHRSLPSWHRGIRTSMSVRCPQKFCYEQDVIYPPTAKKIEIDPDDGVKINLALRNEMI